MKVDKKYFDLLTQAATTKKIELDITDDEIIKKYKDGQYRIVTEQARYPLSSLKEIFKEHNLNPDYQRRRVWDQSRKSRLIESFIINVPVPAVFLYETSFSKYEVMDGLQRISTILDFFDNKYTLKGLEIWPELNGKYYRELPDDIKDGIRRRYLSATILLKETSGFDDEREKILKQFVFERLNTGGVQLSAQEIRNALYPSEFNKMLFEVSENSGIFKLLWGNSKDDAFLRMEDCEIILRYFAYVSACNNNFTKSTKRILDIYAELAVQYNEEDINILKDFYERMLKLTNSLFGANAFVREEGSNTKEKILYDSILMAVTNLVQNQVLTEDNAKNIEHNKYDFLFKNIEEFNGKYTSISDVITRMRLFYDFIKKEIGM